MQQPAHPLNPMSSNPIASITTEQIQKYLDENKQLILAILENQNLGKLAECAQYQAQLQKNLLYLAAIADAQPNAPAVRPQMIPHGSIPQGGHFMQQQAPMFPPRAPLQYNQAQGMMFPGPGHLGMRPGTVNGVHSTLAEPSHGGAANAHGPALAGFPQTGVPSTAVDGRGNKQDAGIGEGAAADSHRSSATEHGSGDVKRPEATRTP